MGFKLTILGSNSARPILARRPSAQILQANQETFLIDCGEGTQLQMIKYGIKSSKINHIFYIPFAWRPLPRFDRFVRYPCSFGQDSNPYAHLCTTHVRESARFAPPNIGLSIALSHRVSSAYRRPKPHYLRNPRING
jgi:hypothetical protein